VRKHAIGHALKLVEPSVSACVITTFMNSLASKMISQMRTSNGDGTDGHSDRRSATIPQSHTGPMQRASVSPVDEAALACGAAESHDLHKRAAAVKACRTADVTDIRHNDSLPAMQFDAQAKEVRADGQVLTCEPATVLPMGSAISSSDACDGADR
jgi:hypothetical protein